MAKKSLTALIFSLLFLFSACGPIPSSYKREDIEKIIKSTCQKEFSLTNIVVKEIKDTLWIYLPLEKFLSGQKIDPKAKEKINHIALVLRRTILSMQNPPKFYALAISDITLGYDYIEIGCVEDLIKVQMRYISIGQLQKRIVQIVRLDEAAKNDTQAKHLQMFNIDFPDFLAMLIAQNIKNSFTQGKFAASYIFVSSQGTYDKQSKTFKINYSAFKKNDAAAAPSLIRQALKIAYHFIVKAYDFKDFDYIEIRNIYSGLARLYNRKAFLEIKLD